MAVDKRIKGRVVKCALSATSMDKSVYKNLWMSPTFMVDRMTLILNRYGIDTVLSHNNFKQEREAWVAAVFLLGLGSIEGSEYWLEINTENGTPDIYAYYLEQVNGNNHRTDLPLEIVDFEDHNETISALIAQKSKKAYPPYYDLIVYARKGGAEIDYDQIFEDAHGIKIPFREIWILSTVTYENDYHLTMVYPYKFQIPFNLNGEYDKHRSQSQLATFLKRGTGTEPHFLGIKEVPLPEIS
jgi:hypothetical protein